MDEICDIHIGIHLTTRRGYVVEVVGAGYVPTDGGKRVKKSSISGTLDGILNEARGLIEEYVKEAGHEEFGDANND